MRKYNKADLVRHVAADTGLSERQTKKVLDTIIHCIHGAVHFNETITIRGFGKFYPRINRRGEEVTAFKPAKRG